MYFIKPVAEMQRTILDSEVIRLKNTIGRYQEVMHCGAFKRAMWELCKNKNLTFQQAEKALGFKDGFVESVEKGIHELTLAEALKIAGYFHTTIDSVLDGGKVECRVHARGVDELGNEQSKSCFEAYAVLLDNLAMRHWKPTLYEEEVNESKLRLERCQRVFVEHYKEHMDELEAEDRVREMAKCEDAVLIKELSSRGYKVEKDGK